LLIVGSAVFISAQNEKNEPSSLLARNIEALGQWEGDDGTGGGGGWLWKKEWASCPIEGQIILDSSCGSLRAGISYKLTASILAQIENCSVTYTIVGEHQGEKSYCRDGWVPWCSKDECR
jgi:hypothetical protein